MKRCTMEFRRKPFIVFYDIKSLRINSKSSILVHQIISLSPVVGIVSLLNGKLEIGKSTFIQTSIVLDRINRINRTKGIKEKGLQVSLKSGRCYPRNLEKWFST